MNIESVVSSWVKERMERIKLRAEILSEGGKCDLQILEIYLEEDNFIRNSITTSRYQNAIDWTNKTLPINTRVGYDVWRFNSKKDAEKFQLMFNLKWAQ